MTSQPTPAEPRRNAYRPIGDYALIGNTHSAALVGMDGSIDWCCLPHFDSSAVFCRLLDVDKGGFFRLGPAGKHTSARRYRDGSAVVETDFTVDGARVRVSDFMHAQRIARSRLGADDPWCHRILRRVEGLAGRVELELEFRPTFDFARGPTALSMTDDGILAVAGKQKLLLRIRPQPKLDIAGDTVSARFGVTAGERVWMMLSHGEGTDATALADADPEALLDETIRHWQEWDRLCTYDGPYHDLVRQSARVLKLLTFGPTGALVAAPTTSLPEEVGGVRNWDYRFSWLRDSALVLNALMSIGYHEAAMDFLRWLEDLCDGECDELQIMYRLDGGRNLPEHELRHLSGYRGSAPVRVGNGAASQTQLDVYGHVLDVAFLCIERLRPVRAGLWRVLRHLADEAAARWREPDHGVWEIRGEPRHFLSSKLLCWVALDRAVRLARRSSLDGDVAAWERERDEARRAILERGYDQQANAFTQAFGSTDLDASALLMPLVGFLPATDVRMRATTEAIRARLTAHGLVYRYLGEDGLPGREATFAICSFWLVDNLALQGRLHAARELFERVVAFRSDLGLLSEEIDPIHHELLGNYPQGFTHLALINSALTIAKAERQLQYSSSETGAISRDSRQVVAGASFSG